MRLERLGSEDPRDVLRALRGAVLGAGPAVAIGAADRPLPQEVPAGTAVVLTTSGSTGVPKSVVLSRSALTASAMATAARIGEGHWLLPLAGGYIAGVQVMVRALVSGREPATLAGRFTPDSFVHAATGMRSFERGAHVSRYTSLVPAQLQTIVEAAEREADVRRALTSFETILVGGQALPRRLHERAVALGARVVRTYGSTETSGGCVYDGVPLDGVRLAKVDGEIRVTGPTLADGYLGDPARTAAVFVEQGGDRWYRTGDAGSIDDGVLSITGRIDNVVVSGGVNVSLDLVERVVRDVPGLEEAVVIGAPHDRWGETPVLVVERPAAGPGAAGPRSAGPAFGALGPGAPGPGDPGPVRGTAGPEPAGHVSGDMEPADPRSVGSASGGPGTADSIAVGPGNAALLDAARTAVARGIGAPARPTRILLVETMPRLASGKPDRRALVALAHRESPPSRRESSQ